jgi:hypothetical protein
MCCGCGAQASQLKAMAAAAAAEPVAPAAPAAEPPARPAQPAAAAAAVLAVQPTAQPAELPAEQGPASAALAARATLYQRTRDVAAANAAGRPVKRVADGSAADHDKRPAKRAAEAASVLRQERSGKRALGSGGPRVEERSAKRVHVGAARMPCVVATAPGAEPCVARGAPAASRIAKITLVVHPRAPVRASTGAIVVACNNSVRAPCAGPAAAGEPDTATGPPSPFAKQCALPFAGAADGGACERALSCAEPPPAKRGSWHGEHVERASSCPGARRPSLQPLLPPATMSAPPVARTRNVIERLADLAVMPPPPPRLPAACPGAGVGNAVAPEARAAEGLLLLHAGECGAVARLLGCHAAARGGPGRPEGSGEMQAWAAMNRCAACSQTLGSRASLRHGSSACRLVRQGQVCRPSWVGSVLRVHRCSCAGHGHGWRRAELRARHRC